MNIQLANCYIGCVLIINIRDRILKSERIRKWILQFFTKQINPRSLRSRCIKGTEESSLEVDSLLPLMHHDLRDLGLICFVRKHNIHFWILSDLRIQSWMLLKKSTLSYRCHLLKYTTTKFHYAKCDSRLSAHGGVGI